MLFLYDFVYLKVNVVVKKKNLYYFKKLTALKIRFAWTSSSQKKASLASSFVLAWPLPSSLLFLSGPFLKLFWIMCYCIWHFWSWAASLITLRGIQRPGFQARLQLPEVTAVPWIKHFSVFSCVWTTIPNKNLEHIIYHHTTSNTLQHLIWICILAL